MVLSMLIKKKLITLGTVQWYFEDGTFFSVPADEIISIDLSNYTQCFTKVLYKFDFTFAKHNILNNVT